MRILDLCRLKWFVGGSDVGAHVYMYKKSKCKQDHEYRNTAIKVLTVRRISGTISGGVWRL